MCSTCGCEATDEVKILLPGEEMKTRIDDHDHDRNHDHHHHHSHDHVHDHSHNHHSHTHSSTVELERDILEKNNLLAERNRGYFEAKNILCMNMVSSPGSGKTSILERTVKELKDDIKFSIIEGDQQTMNDANRIAEAGAPVVQVNTGMGCHLDSDMIHKSIHKLDPEADSVLFVENVGNLVCPSLFDLGENLRVVIMSITEGEDKPLKYPTMFETSQLCLINKMDLMPYLNFDLARALEYVKQVNPGIEILQVSATSEEGLEPWFDWLKQKKKIEHTESINS